VTSNCLAPVAAPIIRCAIPALMAVHCLPIAAEAQVRVDSRPSKVVVLNGASGQPALGDVSSAVRFADGSIAVADPGANAVVLFSRQGEATRTIGRSGQGPGEFRALSSVLKCRGDSLYVWDIALTQVSVFDETGQFARSFRLASQEQIAEVVCSQSLIAAVGFGMPQSSATPPVSLTPEVRLAHLKTSVQLFDFNGAVVSHVRGIRAADLLLSSRIGGPRALAVKPVFALSGEAVVFSDTASGVIVRQARDGFVDTLVAGSLTPARPSEKQWSRAIAWQAGQLPSPARTAYEQVQRSVPPPNALPPYSRLLVDPDGLVWVQTSFLGGGSTRLRVHAQDGTLLTQVVIDRDVNVLQVDRDVVFAVGYDEDDLPTLFEFPIRRGR
jgi:hypothetical protein